MFSIIWSCVATPPKQTQTDRVRSTWATALRTLLFSWRNTEVIKVLVRRATDVRNTWCLTWQTTVYDWHVRWPTSLSSYGSKNSLQRSLWEHRRDLHGKLCELWLWETEIGIKCVFGSKCWNAAHVSAVVMTTTFDTHTHTFLTAALLESDLFSCTQLHFYDLLRLLEISSLTFHRAVNVWNCCLSFPPFSVFVKNLLENFSVLYSCLSHAL